MSRVGRGDPRQGLITARGLPLDVRTGSVAIHGGGAVTLGAFTRTNYIIQPSLETGIGLWSTTAFSLVSGATAARDASAGATRGTFGLRVTTGTINNGVCSATPDLGTFLNGVTYYAQLDVCSPTTPGINLEIVLGSTADDFASAQFVATTSFQTVLIAWTPSADRSASNHGIAIRTKDSGTGDILIDSIYVGTAPGYIDGDHAGGHWLGDPQNSISSVGGGKGARAGIAVSGGGTVATSNLVSSASDVTSAHGGGSITTAAFKAARAAVTVHGGGSIVTVGSSTTLLGFLPGAFLGGGGRVGRGHPAMGLPQPGVIPTSIAGTTSRSGSVAVSGGGSITTVGVKNAQTATAASAGGSLATTASSGHVGAVQVHGGGAVTLSAAATPTAGGIVGGMMLMGGGGRVGRSHPASGVITRAQPRFAVASVNDRTGTVTGTGGGGITTAGHKNAASTTPVSIPAPPPELVDILLLPGALLHGGGSIATAYTRSAPRIGSVAISGGGTIHTTGTKAVSGATTASTGGTPALTARKGALGSTTASSGGTITLTVVLGESRSFALAMSGGGTIRTTGIKGATAATAASSGGTIRTTSIKRATGATTATAGGTVTLTASASGPQPTATVQVHGGGTITLTTSKTVTGHTTASGGGQGATTAAKNAFGTVAVHGGGSVRTTRVTVAVPRFQGIVAPEEELGIPLLLRR